MSIYETKVYRDILFSYIVPIISHHKFHILSTEGGWLTLIFLPYFIPDEERTTTTETCRVDDLNFTFTFAFYVNHFHPMSIWCRNNKITSTSHPCLMTFLITNFMPWTNFEHLVLKNNFFFRNGCRRFLYYNGMKWES